MPAKKKEEFKMTENEMKSITEALKKEEFRKLFAEYAEEISDPKNLELYEREISQMEAERGNNVTFVHLDEGFVVKTKLISKGGGGGSGGGGGRDSKHVDGMKVFVNICKSKEIDEATMDIAVDPKTGRNGEHWTLPHTFNPEREDKDKAGDPCLVFDCAFNPATYERGVSNARFRLFIVQTAIESLERNFCIQLSREFKYPKLTFKGVAPKSVIRNDVAPTTAASLSARDDAEPHGIHSVEELKKIAENATKEQEGQSGEIRNETKSTSPLIEELSTTTDACSTSTGTRTPEYHIVHRGTIDLGEYTMARKSSRPSRPAALVVHISLPLISSAADVDLDVMENEIQLISSSPSMYKLDAALPFPVDSDAGTAKFDKSKKVLVLTLPVLPGKLEFDVTEPSIVTVEQEQDHHADSDTVADVDTDADVNSNTETDTTTNNVVEESSNESADARISNDGLSGLSVKSRMPSFSMNQDDEAIVFVFNVRDVAANTVKCDISCGGLLIVEFAVLDHYGDVCSKYEFAAKGATPDHMFRGDSGCTVDVSELNVVVTAMKVTSCSDWNSIYVGKDPTGWLLDERQFMTGVNVAAALEEDETATTTINRKHVSWSPNLVEGEERIVAEIESLSHEETVIAVASGETVVDEKTTITPPIAGFSPHVPAVELTNSLMYDLDD